MASDLIELARKAVGEGFAEEIERLEDELETLAEARGDEETLNQQLKEQTELPDVTINDLSTEMKREVLEEVEETRSVEIPVAGRTNSEISESSTVEIENSNPDTYTKEVEIPVPGRKGESTTKTVEYANHGPPIEAINEYHGWLNQARAESSRHNQERMNQQRESQLSGGIPDYGYVNADEIDGEDIDDSDIPVPGQRPTEETDD